WRPTPPQRSSRPGGAGPRLDLAPAHGGPEMAPNPPSARGRPGFAGAPLDTPTGVAFDDGRRPGPAAERVHSPRGHGVPPGREPPVGRVVARLDVDPRIGQVTVDVQVEPRGRAGAAHAEADQGL